MSSQITDFIKYELYPALYSCIDRAFPEHSFRPYPNEWRSKTYITGAPHKDRADKTVVTKKAPGRILEQGGDNLSLVDYVMKRDRVEFIEAVKTLAEVVGLQLPKGEFNQEVYQKYKNKASLLEECSSYFQRCLETTTKEQEIERYKTLYPLPINSGKGDEDMRQMTYAMFIGSRDYLKRRGYKDEDIKAMELGYIPDQESLFKYLHSKGFSQSLIDEVLPIKKDTRIGKSHTIVIPYRSGGELKGFKFRVREGGYYEAMDITPKYVNSIGLDKLSGFFNISAIKGDKDVVIVEGELDSLSATVRGVENVVATGGSSITPEQVRDAIKRGAKKFTICFDTEANSKEQFPSSNSGAPIEKITWENDLVYVPPSIPDTSSIFDRLLGTAVEFDGETVYLGETKENIKPKPSKEEINKKNIERAIEVILGEGVNRVYIATLPESKEGKKVDPDSFIKDYGIESLKGVINRALPYYEYRLQELLKRFNLLEQERGYLTPKELDNLLDEVVGIATNIPEPIDRDVFKKLFTSLPAIKELGITEESFDITVDRITSTKDKEAQAVALKELLSEAKDYQDKGEVEESIKLLEDKIKEVRLQDKRANYSSLLMPTTEAQIKDEEKGLPGSLKTGYTISGEELLLPGGAITVYAGATGHGKTVMAINTVLNVASAYPDKKFVFFTYEERASAILQYFLNTYVDIALNSAQSANRRVLQEYFKTGSTQYLSGEVLDYFQSKKDEFFKTYIETGRILVKYVSLNSEELTSAIRYIHKEEPNIAGVFIDYFQLLNLPGGVKRAERINSRQEELKRICIALKDVAVDTGLPLCLTAQFNREVYNLLDIHPTKIREAADIEQIVNTLVGLWNLGKKDVAKETTGGNLNEIKLRTGGAESGMYVELLKSRDLSTGIYEVLEFNGNTGKVKNSSTDYSFFDNSK